MAETTTTPANRYLQEGSHAEEAWLEWSLEDGETALVWLPISSISFPDSVEAPPGKLKWRFLLTTERMRLVGLPKSTTETFDWDEAKTFDLPGSDALDVTGRVGRDRVAVGDWRWKAQLNNEELFHEIAALPSLEPSARRVETARLNWAQRTSMGRSAVFARKLLAPVDGTSPFAFLARCYLEGVVEREEPFSEALDGAQVAKGLRPALRALVPVEEAGVKLVEWCAAWRVPPRQQMALVRHLVELGEREGLPAAVEIALPLHEQAHGLLAKYAKDLVEQSLLDLALAGHLLKAGKVGESLEILEERLTRLPDESLLDLLPPKEVDLTRQGTQVVRIRLLELLVEARGDPDTPDLDAVTELARLQPLVKGRLEDLVAISSGDLRGRAETLGRLLDPDGLSIERVAAEPLREANAIPKEDIEERLPHPVTRKGGAFDWLQGRLGRARSPDHGVLRSYAERVSERKHPEVMAALADASLALGVPGVEAYISRGEQGWGVRAYEGSPPFIIIGGQHLEEGSEVHLKGHSLVFTLASEVAHLRFKHTRLTSSELWDGVFHKGSQLLEVLGAFAGPLGFLGSAVGGLRRLAVVQRVFQSAEIVSKGAGKAVEIVGYAQGIQGLGSKIGEGESAPKETEIGDRESELLAACRLLQLTADRAGLVLCGEPRAAVEAIFLTAGEYRAELPLARRHGLVKALSRRGPEGELMNQALSIRLASLFSFYLSPDYPRLSKARWGIPAESSHRIKEGSV